MFTCVLLAGQLWISDPNYSEYSTVAVVPVEKIVTVSKEGIQMLYGSYLYFNRYNRSQEDTAENFIAALKSCPNNGETK